jgi:uncharacterized membrane protein
MDSNAIFAKQSTDEIDLLGLKFSAGLLVALGCLWGLYAILFASMLVIAGVRALQGRAHNVSDARFLLTSALVIVITSALTWLCIRAAKALREARQWGAYVAMAFGLLLLLFTGTFVYDMYHPERQGPDEAFGILIVPFMCLVGLWWCVYLNLPYVRRRLANTHSR